MAEGESDQGPIADASTSGEAKRESGSEAFKNVSLGIAGVMSSILIPLVGYIYSAQESDRQIKAQDTQKAAERDFQKAQRERELQSSTDEKNKDIARNFVELGIKILSEKPRAKDDPVRIWAIDVVNHYSEIQLTPAAKQALARGSFFSGAAGAGQITAQGLSSLGDLGFTRGAGISHFNHDIDFPQLKAKGMAFVYAKATQGAASRDPDVQSFADAARAAGLPIGLYHFFMPTAAPDAQAQNFLSVYRSTASTLPPMVDCEDGPWGAAGPDYADKLAAFLTAIETATGHIPAIYVSRGFAEEHLDPRFGRYPLFIAQYSQAARNGKPALPRWWTKATFISVASGISDDPMLRAVEIITFKGDLETLTARNGRTPPETR